ncbi:hypothetical protein HDR67_00665 [bacterium]|nr:hypothetical protein [bacterium]
MEKKMLDVKVQENRTIELPEKVLEHLGVKVGEDVRILLSEDSIVMMSIPKFGEALLKKL